MSLVQHRYWVRRRSAPGGTILHAILLAGGRGRRLRPLSDVRPKPLVPVANRPLIERQLLALAAAGVREARLAIGRDQESFLRQSLADGRALGLRLRYAVEAAPLGSGGAVAAALVSGPVFNPVLVCNADIVSRFDPAAMLHAHRAAGAEVSIALSEVDDPSRFGVVSLDDDGRISRFAEKPAAGAVASRPGGAYWANAGYWLIDPQRLAGIDPTRFSRLEETLFPAMAAAGEPIFGLPLPDVGGGDLWLDVGTPAAYREANRRLLEGIGLRIGAGASVDATARIEGDVQLGPGVVVGAEARLSGPIAIGRDCRIGPGAILRDCVLWERVRIGAGARLRGCVVTDEARIAPGERLRQTIRTSAGPDTSLGESRSAR